MLEQPIDPSNVTPLSRCCADYVADLQVDNSLERLAAVATNTSEPNYGSNPIFGPEDWTSLLNGLGPAGAADPT